MQTFLCHRFSRVIKSDFLEARSPIVEFTYLHVVLYPYLYFALPFVFGETPKRVLLQTVKAKMKLHFIRLYTACKDKTINRRRKRINFGFLFLKLQPDTLDMYNGLSQVHCINPEGRIHKYAKD